jgi:hypothetical protein
MRLRKLSTGCWREVHSNSLSACPAGRNIAKVEIGLDKPTGGLRQMRIQNVEIENLRGIEAIHFEPDKLVNVIVGPNAIGKTTILEGTRLTKAMLAPRYFQETQQALISLGAVSPQFQFFGIPRQVDYTALARDTGKALRIQIEVQMTTAEIDILQGNLPQLALNLLRAQTGQTGEQAQFALTQYLSSEEGQAALAKANLDIVARVQDLRKMPQLKLELIFDPASQIKGSDVFSQVAFAFLDQRLPSQLTLMDYFPADRAFPAGEVNVQIGSADAGNQIQSYIGQPASKYQRLKQTIVHGIITNQISEKWLDAEFNEILSRQYEIAMDQLTFKKRVIRQMQIEASESWRVIESTIRNELQ